MERYTWKYQQVWFVTELQNVTEDDFNKTLRSENATIYRRFHREIFDGMDNSSLMKLPEPVFLSRKELSLSMRIRNGEISRSYIMGGERFMGDINHFTEVNINVSVPNPNRIMDNKL